MRRDPIDDVLTALPGDDRLVASVEEAAALGIRRPGTPEGHPVERWVAGEGRAAGRDVRLSRIDVPTWTHAPAPAPDP